MTIEPLAAWRSVMDAEGSSKAELGEPTPCKAVDVNGSERRVAACSINGAGRSSQAGPSKAGGGGDDGEYGGE